jgi:hypothetical protein
MDADQIRIHPRQSVSLLGLAARFRDKVFDIGDLSRQRFTHPAHAIRCDQQVVLDPDADAFVPR